MLRGYKVYKEKPDSRDADPFFASTIHRHHDEDDGICTGQEVTNQVSFPQCTNILSESTASAAESSGKSVATSTAAKKSRPQTQNEESYYILLYCHQTAV